MHGALGARPQLAVREGAGPAQAELYVARGVELARALEVLDVVAALVGVPSALDEQGLEAGLGKRERAEEPRTSGTDDDGSLGGGGAQVGRPGKAVLLDLPELPQHGGMPPVEPAKELGLGVGPSPQLHAGAVAEVDV